MIRCKKYLKNFYYVILSWIITRRVVVGAFGVRAEETPPRYTVLIANPKMSSLNTKNSYGTPIMVTVDNWRDETVIEMLEIEGIELKTRNS